MYEYTVLEDHVPWNVMVYKEMLFLNANMAPESLKQ